MGINVTLPDVTKAELQHLADEDDHYAIALEAIITALANSSGSGLATVAPVDPDTAAAAVGVATLAARGDHKHHLAVATGSVAGLESAADKTKLDTLPADITLANPGVKTIAGGAQGDLASITLDAHGRVTAFALVP